MQMPMCMGPPVAGIGGTVPQAPVVRRRCGATTATRTSEEDALREEGRDDPVGYIDDFADLEIHRHAAENVGLLAREPALFDEVVDHVANRLLRRAVEVGAVGRGREV